MCVTLLYRPQVEQRGLSPKLINCLNLCQKYKRGGWWTDVIGWQLVASSSWIEIPRNESGASQRWAGGDWTADYWDRGKQPRFWTMPIMDTVARNQGSGHIWKLPQPWIRKVPDQLICWMQSILKTMATKRMLRSFWRKSAQQELTPSTLTDVIFGSIPVLSCSLPFYSLFASRCLLYSPARKPFMLWPLY